MTHLPMLPNGFDWVGRQLVLRAETKEGVPLYVVIASPKTFDQFDALLLHPCRWHRHGVQLRKGRINVTSL